MNSTPQLPGYELDQRLLEHPLAEIWRGRSFTGMEVVALVLSEGGAADEQVRQRLDRASRTAALEPGEQQTPLWAANLTAARPYAVTQLVRGQSGAERLLDPLDGLLGNDEESLGAVRSQLAQYGAVPIRDLPEQTPRGTGSPYGAHGGGGGTRGAGTAAPGAGDANGALGGEAGAQGVADTAWPQASVDEARDSAHAAGARGSANVVEALGGADAVDARGSADAGAARGSADVGARGGSVGDVVGEGSEGGGVWGSGWVKVGAVVVVLAVFSVLYSLGSAIGSQTKEPRPAGPVPGPYVSPAALPSPVLRPGVVKPKPATYIPPVPAPGLVGATYERGADVQEVSGLGLPFIFGWPRPPKTSDVGISATTIYRRVATERPNGQVTLNAQIALRPCATLAACLTDRAAFEQEWTSTLKAPAPTTAKDSRTWLTEQPGTPYRLSMTHAFTTNGESWLIGVVLAAVPGEEQAAQRVLNDIWRQTQ